MMLIKIVPNTTYAMPERLADVELHFNSGPLEGLKLIGFAVIAQRTGAQAVTFPGRKYAVNGATHTFALLRPTDSGNTAGQARLRDLILAAYLEHIAATAEVTA